MSGRSSWAHLARTVSPVRVASQALAFSVPPRAPMLTQYRAEGQSMSPTGKTFSPAEQPTTVSNSPPSCLRMNPQDTRPAGAMTSMHQGTRRITKGRGRQLTRAFLAFTLPRVAHGALRNLDGAFGTAWGPTTRSFRRPLRATQGEMRAAGIPRTLSRRRAPLGGQSSQSRRPADGGRWPVPASPAAVPPQRRSPRQLEASET